MSTTIRRAALADADALAQLMTQLGYLTSPVEMETRMRAIETDENFAAFVAIEESEVCGMIGLSASLSFEHNDRTGRIVVLVVREGARGHGVGRKLVAAAEEYFRTHQIARVSLTTRLEREGAHRFYEALGFARTGFRFAKLLA